MQLSEVEQDAIAYTGRSFGIVCGAIAWQPLIFNFASLKRLVFKMWIAGTKILALLFLVVIDRL
ncbi:MAG: hypothetical protein V7L00_24415 [Nostoc sp.]|uniref:hypothetical protein n=1 Tax=unclassified Nostoc TaxID=2593658 RepID=UPI0025CB7B3C|nr:hypothetical protein [Nostoc sp. JL33]MBN3869733.1 hypothetical protein [Nostoc sp. JL33]